MASRPTISEGWEDIADDNLSVISLESSSSSNQGSSLDRSPTPTPISNTPDVNERVPNTDIKILGDNKGKDKRAENYPDTERGEGSITDSSSINKLQEHEREVSEGYDNVNEDVDPRFLKAILESINDILDETICLEVPNAIYTADGKNPFTICRRIRGQLRELAPILSGYAKAMASNDSSDDIPIDPGLHSWLSGVRVKALSLQATARNSLEKLVYNLEPNQAFVGIVQDLEEYEDKMDEFLPIMQVDFNEFQTKFMNLPIAPVPSTTHHPSRSEPIRIPSPGSSRPLSGSPLGSISQCSKLPILRQELYNLKDAISQAQSRLILVRGTRSEPWEVKGAACHLASKLYDINEAISTILSNNGSEWIDSGISGGMSYAEFIALDTHYVIDLRHELQDMLALEPEQIRLPVRPDLARYFAQDPPSSSAPQRLPSYRDWEAETRNIKLEVTKAAMDDLITFVEILTEIFKPKSITPGIDGAMCPFSGPPLPKPQVQQPQQGEQENGKIEADEEEEGEEDNHEKDEEEEKEFSSPNQHPSAIEQPEIQHPSLVEELKIQTLEHQSSESTCLGRRISVVNQTV